MAIQTGLVQVFSWFPVSACITPMLHRLILVPYLVILALALTAAWLYFDRADPLVIVEQTVVPAGRPGQVLRIDAKVDRDFTPPCSVEASRIIISKSGYRFFDGIYWLDAKALMASVGNAPDKLRTTVVVPASIDPGRAKLVTSLTYNCNVLDRLFPVTATTVLLFDVVE